MEPPGAETHGLVLVGYPRWVALRAGITSLRHIGAESSHSNKVVIRRLSYLDLLLIGRFLLLYAKGNSGGQQIRQPAGLEEMAKPVGIKNQGMRETKSLPFL